MKKITAGRDRLGDFAPQFASLNDDILFGEVWSRTSSLPVKTRSMITISALMGAGITDQAMSAHLELGKENGITKVEMIEMITQLAFYAGWPKAWAIFPMVMEIYGDEESIPNALFGLGEKLELDYFTGDVYANEIHGHDKRVTVVNVTFEPGCINNWHKHQIGQTLLVTSGRGWYQEVGKEPRELHAGDIVEIGAGVKHWHGSAKDSWFSHLSLEDPSKGAPDWLEPVNKEVYNQLP